MERLEERRLLAVQPFPLPLSPAISDASLIERGQTVATIDTAGETESFTINLDAGQALTLLADPASGLRTSIELVDPAATQLATAVHVVQPTTLRFVLPALPDGTHNISLPAGAVTDLQGQPLAEFQSHHTVDQTGPRVIASSLLVNDVVDPGMLTYTATFNEPLDPTQLGASDVELTGNLTGAILPTGLHYDPATYTLSLEFEGLAEDAYTLRLLSGDGRFEDLLGNDLDGEIDPATTVPSGDGLPGGDFVLNFSADFAVSALPGPLTAVFPLGSLIYEGLVDGTIQSPLDVDRFSVQLGAGQTATVVTKAFFRAEVSLFHEEAGESTLLATATASAPGETVLLNSIPITDAGEYHIQVVALDGGEGIYGIELLLNATIELEELNGPRNDAPTDAQPIEDAFIPLGFAGAERAAVVGADTVSRTEILLFEETFSTPTPDPANWPTFTATIDNVALNEPSEPNAGRFNANDVAESTGIDLSEFTSATIRYFVEEAGGGSAAETGDDLLLEYFNASGQWVTLDTNLGSGPSMTQFVERELTLPADALHAGFRFRFQANTSVSGDDWFVDDIRLTATPLVVGESGDWYRFSLADGEGATIAVHGPEAHVELYDATGGTLLARGTGAKNAAQVTNNFVDQTNDGASSDYLVLVSGTTRDYRLIVTRGAEFDTEDNDSFETAQDISGLSGVLGHVVSAEISAGASSGVPTGAAIAATTDEYLPDELSNPVFPVGWLGEIYAAAADGGVTQDHTEDPLTIVLDFNDLSQPNTTDGLGNTITTFDVTAFGLAPGHFNIVIESVLDQVRRHYFDIATSDVFPQSPIPPGMELALEFVIGDIGTPPSNGSTDYYYIQIGTGVSGQCIGALGCASVNSIRNSVGVPGAAVGSVIGSIFSDAIQAMGGLSPTDALSSGDLEFTTNALAGTISHEVAHGLSLAHLNWAGAITPNGYPPLMGTGAIDLPNQLRIGEREFAYSGFNAQNGGVEQFHMDQLVSAVGLHAADTLPNPSDPLAPDEDWYQFAVSAGDFLNVDLFAPGSEGGEFPNPAAPFLRAELIDPSGTIVEQAGTSISHTAAITGNYRLRVFTEEMAGEYVVSLSGATGQNSPPSVVASSLVDGSRLDVLPDTITVRFSEALAAGSVQPGDLLINGTPASSMVESLDGFSYRFTVDPAINSGDGVYEVAIPAGAVTDLQGITNVAHVTSFQLDTIGVRVLATQFNGAALPVTRLVDGGALTFTAQVSEDLLPTFGPSAVQLVELGTGAPIPADVIAYDPATDLITAQYAALAEGRYELRLHSGDGLIEDLAGNDLDGEPLGPQVDGTPSGDGMPGGDFVVRFTVDAQIVTSAHPFERLLPLGSQIARSGGNMGLINTPGDVDEFAVFLQAGQVVSFVATPDDAAASLSVTLLGAGGPVTSPSPGAPAVLAMAEVPSSGIYTLRVIGNAPTRYVVDIVTGAFLEALAVDSSSTNPLPLNAPASPNSTGLYAGVGRIDPAPSMSAVLVQDFNLGIGNFVINNGSGSANGLWHWTTGRSADGLPNHTPAGSLYFGQNETPLVGGNYQTGSAVGGTVTSPVISLPANAVAASLSFHHLLATEGSPLYDIARVEIVTNDTTTLRSTADGTLPMDTDGAWDQVRVDLTQFAGQTVRIAFAFDSITADHNNFEGWFVDDVRIEVATSVIPDVDQYTIDLSGAAGEHIDILVAGQASQSQANALIELLGVDGTTVLATASSDPLGEAAGGYDQAILGFQVPVGGMYTLRVVSDVADDYSVVVTRSLVFDSEPNNSQTEDTIRSLNGTSGAVGMLDNEQHADSLVDEPNDTITHSVASGVGPTNGSWAERGHIGDHPHLTDPTDDVDMVQLELAAGERAVFRVVASQQGSSLDPMLSLFNSAGVLIAQNDDFFGLDSLIDFTANVSDTYYVAVSSYPNFSYDPFVEGSGNGGSTGFYDLFIDVGLQQSSGTGELPFYAPKPSHQHDEDRLVFKKDDPLVAVVGQELAALAVNHDREQAGAGHTHAALPLGGAYDLLQTAGEYVAIDAVASGEPLALWEELLELGLEQGSIFQRVISGMLPIDAIRDMAGLSTLKFARPVWRPITMVGITTSQADVAMRTDVARSHFGVDGSGVTVGVLSDSYDTGPGSAAADILSGDLPGAGNPLGRTNAVNVLSDLGSGSDEGRAMLQLIHDVAPGADLAFHTAFHGEADFANGILELASVAGAEVIVDDVIYLAEPMFQDGIIAQAIDTVVANGVSYFSAAGNNGRQSWEGSYQASGIFDPLFGTQLHDFAAGPAVDPFQSVTIPLRQSLTFAFQWDEPFFSVSGGTGSTNDLDIFIFDATGSTILASSTINNVGQDPVEVFTFTNGTRATTNFNIAIGLADGAEASLMKWVAFGSLDINEYVTESATTYGHANASGAAAVGAAFYLDTPGFGLHPPVIEPFSSAGGTAILFDAAGNPIHQVRAKPNFVAPDGTNTTFFGQDVDGDSFPNFFGTSAAAPHAAALAALMTELNPSATPAEIYAAMAASAIDMDDPYTPGFDTGFDSLTGTGLVEAEGALALIVADPALTGPRVVSVSPPSGPTEDLLITGITIEFSEPPTLESAENAGNYLLLEAGPNGVFESGAGDDRRIAVTPVFDGNTTVDLVVNGGTPLGVGRYQLVVRAGIVDSDGNELGSITSPGGGRDRIHYFEVVFNPPKGGDLFTIDVPYGQALTLVTSTPWNDAGATPLNDLDPQLVLFDPLGHIVAIDQDGAADGKNARLRHVAAIGGTYTIHIAPQTGIGEYRLSADLATPPRPTGDYNGDGFVNTADFVLWRNSQDMQLSPGTGADGNGDGIVSSADYDVWRAHFGNSIFNTDTSAQAAATASVLELTPAANGESSSLTVDIDLSPMGDMPNVASSASIVDQALRELLRIGSPWNGTDAETLVDFLLVEAPAAGSSAALDLLLARRSQSEDHDGHRLGEMETAPPAGRPTDRHWELKWEMIGHEWDA